MLARPYGPKSPTLCYVQPKCNGIRALYQNGTFQSRDEKLWKTGKLAHLLHALRTLPIGDTILDGELYVHGWKLQRINSAVSVNSPIVTPDTLLLEYHVFDAIHPTEPTALFSERYLDLRSVIVSHNSRHIHAVETLECADRQHQDQLFHHYVATGYEGIMIRTDGVYEPGKRSKTLYKRKQWEDGEYECVGTTKGDGKAAIGIGALTLGVHSGDYLSKLVFFNVGTGFDDAERIILAANPPIGRLVRVRYPYLSADGIPQCPSFIAVL